MTDTDVAMTIFGQILLTRKNRSDIILANLLRSCRCIVFHHTRTVSMSTELLKFSKEQWNLLAFLDAFKAPIPIDLAVSVAPLSPATLLDLVERSLEHGLIIRQGVEVIQIANNLNESVKNQLEELNTPRQVTSWLEMLESSGLMGSLNPSDLIPLYLKSGDEKMASELGMTIGLEAVRYDRGEVAMDSLKKALERLTNISGNSNFESMVIRATLEYSDLCFAMGKDFNILPMFLERALKAAQRVGDHRSETMVNFHLGRVLYFANQRAHALILFSQGQKGVKELGDLDILVRSAEFLGLYYFMQGLPKKAIEHFERAIQDMEIKGKSPHINSTTIIFFGYCAVYLGQFHKAIGFLDYHWHLALEKSNLRQAATIRASLGTVLSFIGRIDESIYHLTRSEKEARDLENKLSLYLSKGGLCYCEFLRGKTEKARDLLVELFAEGKSFGMVYQYASPFVIEMVSEFKRMGFEDIPGMPFEKEINRLLADPNIHLRGVALRLRARLAADREGNKEEIRKDLNDSEAYLKCSEDPVQLAKTWLEMARLKLTENKKEEASLLTKKARLGLAGFGNEFFPDDLGHLLEDNLQKPQKASFSHEEFVNRFLAMMEELYPENQEENLLNSTVMATNRLFQAERGGLFRIGSGSQKGMPELQAACNLSPGEVNSADFKLSLQIVQKVAKTGEPLIIRHSDPILTNHRLKSILCLPIEDRGDITSVLYYDNSYLNDGFEFLDHSLIQKLIYQIANYIRRIQGYSQKLERSNQVPLRLMEKGEIENIELLTQSSVMNEIIGQADKVASSDSTVLISGETGVGKELLAKRIHYASSRRNGPFIVVDMTTIPENLVESELFGHEKGAFTGADRQLKGRFELANGGTLFIDEIGEAPKPAQTRLLRAIQEKSFYRVGGTREIKSDFRLLAATNRDLAVDVNGGVFRKDLFYRLNVMPLTIPPLRKRGSDILILANHFLSIFAQKYNYTKPKLSSEDERRLMDYGWPGNVRELKNIMERAVVLSNLGQFELALPSSPDSRTSDIISDDPSFDELQRRYFKIVLEKTNGRISGKEGAAELLGIPRTTLNARLKKLGLR